MEEASKQGEEEDSCMSSADSSLKTRKPIARVGKRKPKCKVCGEPFERTRSFQPTCHKVECAMEYLKRKEVEKRVAPYRTKPRKPNNSKSHQKELTQKAVNAYVRWRDRLKPCVTCGEPPGKTVRGGNRDAGHFLPRSVYPSIRYDIRQIHAQCVNCNQYNSGRRHEYRLFMIAEYGLELVEWFEQQNKPADFAIDELKEIRATYRKMLRDEQRASGFKTT